MSKSVAATFDGKVFVPEGAVDMPPGSRVELQVKLRRMRGTSGPELVELLGRHSVDEQAMLELERFVEENCEGIDRDEW